MIHNHNTVTSETWEYMIEEGEHLIRCQLINSLMRVYARSEHKDGKVKINHI